MCGTQTFRKFHHVKNVRSLTHGYSAPILEHQTEMASQRLQKLFKVKPVKPLQLDPEVDPNAPEQIIYGNTRPEVVLPPVTASDRKRWAKARALQQSDEHGQPVEGWAARIATMKADGRLVEVNGSWHQRDP
jgi:hypothetical protein